MKHFLTFLPIFFALVSTTGTYAGHSQGIPGSQGVQQHQTAGYTFSIIATTNKTWGYDIYADRKLFIHQPGMPGIQGNDGFKSKKDAEKVAKMVIGKIKKGEIPPTVTVEELKKLKVL
jgi:hypothetical protein